MLRALFFHLVELLVVELVVPDVRSGLPAPAIERADLIINVGHDVSEKPPFIMRKDGQSVIHISYFAAEMDDVYFPQHEVIGCTATNMRMLADAIESSASWDFDFFECVRAEIETHVFAEKADAEGFPNVPQRIVADLRRAMPSDGIGK